MIPQRLILFLFVIFSIQGIFGEQCLNDQWPPKPDRVVPTHVVNLDLPAIERWKEISTLYKPAIADLVDYIKTFVASISPEFQFLITLVDTKLVNSKIYILQLLLMTFNSQRWLIHYQHRMVTK
jgi:hypothetical protein